VHWLPMFSQAFLTEGRAYWGKMQSIFALVRFFGGNEPLAWVLQWILTGTVAVVLVAMWRSRIDYALKAAGLAIGTLLVTPYLFLYDVMVLAVPVGFLVRLGLSEGFRRYELPALGLTAFLLMFYPLFAAPTGFAATLIVALLVGRRCGLRRSEAETPDLIAARA
jgi:arabinofuranan 3-O-arabinosyltransferase